MPDLGLWPLRILWILVPVSAGTGMADALADADDLFRVSVTVLGWLIWTGVLLALLIPHPATLTIARIVIPAALVTALATVPSSTNVAALVAGASVLAGATVLAFLPTTGDVFIDAASYGTERRFALRPPAALLAGPVELAWVVTVVGSLAGPVLLLDGRWIAGAVLILIGWPAVFVSVRALYTLSQRWLVFVPAGLVVHDHLAMAEPVLFASGRIRSFGPAGVDSADQTGVEDLTQRSLGLVLEIDMDETMSINRRLGRSASNPIDVTGVLVSPSRPGAVLDEAENRKIKVG